MKKVITEQNIIELFKKGIKNIPVGKEDILTPLAIDKIRELKLNIVAKSESKSFSVNENQIEEQTSNKIIALGSDHTGYKAKNMIMEILANEGWRIIDVGTYSEESCDYPDFAFAAASKVKEKEASFAIVFDATGIPSAITANKIKGIRAATCYNEFSAVSTRSHNNANVLVLGAKTLGEEVIKSIVKTFLSTPFEGGRHARRLDKISQIEKEQNNSQ